jgi:hypothetical protein
METKVCIIGAGPAGLMAAVHSAAAGAQTIVLESNTVAGRKLLLTGGGRCNFTHHATADEFIRAIGSKGRFLSFCLHEFPPLKTRRFFHAHGLQSTVDKTGCVFPFSQRASDVRDLLVSQANSLSVRFCYDRRVTSILKEPHRFLIRAGKDTISAKKLIIATGGLSYSQTGSTGDGYKFAKILEHSITEPKPSLVPLITRQTWPKELAGTAVENVKVSAVINNRRVETTGPLMFTDDGIAGPAVLDMSRFLSDLLPSIDNPIEVSIDLAQTISLPEIEKHLLDQIAANPKKSVANILAALVPRRVAPVLCKQLACAPDLLACRLKKALRKKLAHLIKALPLSIVRARPVAEATVTRGGVTTIEINPKTMESKICPGLFFAGEVIDADGPCGGYNLQIAWSTGALAGASAAKAP